MNSTEAHVRKTLWVKWNNDPEGFEQDYPGMDFDEAVEACLNQEADAMEGFYDA